MKSEEKEFLRIITQYQGIIHKVDFMYFRTSDDKKDNFQEIVYHLWRSYKSLKDESKIGSWIYAVAINVSISKIRKDSKYVFANSIPDVEYTDEIDQIEQDIKFSATVECHSTLQ